MLAKYAIISTQRLIWTPILRAGSLVSPALFALSIASIRESRCNLFGSRTRKNVPNVLDFSLSTQRVHNPLSAFSQPSRILTLLSNASFCLSSLSPTRLRRTRDPDLSNLYPHLLPRHGGFLTFRSTQSDPVPLLLLHAAQRTSAVSFVR